MSAVVFLGLNGQRLVAKANSLYELVDGIPAGRVETQLPLPPSAGKIIVTLLCDSATHYQIKMFNPAFLHEKGLPTPPWR
jgi:hypothetical protein